MECDGEEWARIADRIPVLYEKAKGLAARAALAGRPRLFRAASRAAERLLELQHDLEAWLPRECFDMVEFDVRLSRIEGVLRRVEKRLAGPACPSSALGTQQPLPGRSPLYLCVRDALAGATLPSLPSP